MIDVRNDSRPWSEYNEPDFANTTTIQVDGRKLKSRRGTLTHVVLSERIRPEGIQQLRVKNKHKTILADPVAPKTKGIDESGLRRIEDHKFKGVWQGNVYRLAYVLQCHVHDLLANPADTATDRHLNNSVTQVNLYAKTLLRLLGPGHPHLDFVTDQIRSVLNSTKKSDRPLRLTSTTPAADYGLRALRKRNDDHRKDCQAIADLSDGTELDLWLSGLAPHPKETWVHKRIFIITWEQVLDHGKFSEIVCLLYKHATYRPNDYIVYVSIIDSKRWVLGHPLGSTAVGHHLELFGLDCVGGYERASAHHEKHYVLATDLDPQKDLYNAALEYFSEVEKHSFQVTPLDPSSSLDAEIEIEIEHKQETVIRHGLNKLCGIGDYSPHWGRHADRSAEYFNKYDINIQTWITKRWYSALNRHCSQRIIRELLSRFNRHTKIFEVGYGTGAMTQMILDWVSAQSRLADEVQCPQPGSTFLYGLDAASQMKRLAQERFHSYTQWCRFNEGEFSEQVASGLIGKDHKIDILCGTLVLHDLLGPREDVDHSLPGLLRTLAALISADGIVLWGDIIKPDRKGAWEKELECWVKGMRREGMTKDQIDRFLERNAEMHHPVEEHQLREHAVKFGFKADIISLNQHQEPSPFKLCKLSRNTAVSQVSHALM